MRAGRRRGARSLAEGAAGRGAPGPAAGRSGPPGEGAPGGPHRRPGGHEPRARGPARPRRVELPRHGAQGRRTARAGAVVEVDSPTHTHPSGLPHQPVTADGRASRLCGTQAVLGRLEPCVEEGAPGAGPQGARRHPGPETAGPRGRGRIGVLRVGGRGAVPKPDGGVERPLLSVRSPLPGAAQRPRPRLDQVPQPLSARPRPAHHHRTARPLDLPAVRAADDGHPCRRLPGPRHLCVYVLTFPAPE